MSHTNKLKSYLEQLLNDAKQLDERPFTNNKALFDRVLFKCGSRKLTPYVKEAFLTYTAIQQTQEQNLDKIEQIEHLTTRLLNQISALKREIATHQLRCGQQTSCNNTTATLSELYSQLAQHNEWERRLIEMVCTKDASWRAASGKNKSQAKQTLVVVEQRLARCQKSKKAIKMDIQLIESNQ